MSVQGGTLGRLGTRHMPIWPVAMLLAAAVAAAVALSAIGSSVGEVPRPATTDAVFEEITFPRGLEHAGAYPAAVSTIQMIRSGAAQADAYVGSLVARAPVTGSAIWKAQADAYVGSLVAAAGGDAIVTHAVGLENPGAYGISQVTEATYPTGLENPGAYPADGTFTPKVGGHQPIVVNGTVCGQCR